MIYPLILVALATGSFLSVCIYRIPFGRPKGPPGWEDDLVENQESNTTEPSPAPPKLSIFFPPRSFCPSCNTQLYWWHNIPFFSWIMLQGRCWFCKATISARYPAVELLTVLMMLLSINEFGYTPTAAVVFVFCCVLIVLSFIDIDYYIIPDVISLPGIVLGVIISAINQQWHIFEWPVASSLWVSLVGVAFGGGVLWLISEVYLRLRHREGLGLGDVKLLAMTGAFFGISGALYTMFIGSVLGSVLGMFLILLFGKKMTHQLPFGPYLAVGTLLYFFASRSFLAWPP